MSIVDTDAAGNHKLLPHPMFPSHAGMHTYDERMKQLKQRGNNIRETPLLN